VFAVEVLVACGGSGSDSCGQTASKRLAVGESTKVTLQRSGNVWRPIDIDGQDWNFQAQGPNDVPNGTYQATVTLKDPLKLEVVLADHEPVVLDRVGCE
jgi:hypothetical protein